MVHFQFLITTENNSYINNKTIIIINNTTMAIVKILDQRQKNWLLTQIKIITPKIQHR